MDAYAEAFPAEAEAPEIPPPAEGARWAEHQATDPDANYDGFDANSFDDMLALTTAGNIHMARWLQAHHKATKEQEEAARRRAREHLERMAAEGKAARRPATPPPEAEPTTSTAGIRLRQERRRTVTVTPEATTIVSETRTKVVIPTAGQPGPRIRMRRGAPKPGIMASAVNAVADAAETAAADLRRHVAETTWAPEPEPPEDKLGV